MSSIWTPLDNIDPHCFGCGPENDKGLKMRFETNGEKLRSHVSVPEHFRGWSNLVHGGIISTMIDEMMSWSAIHLHKSFILTKSMAVNFKKPIRIQKELIVYGFEVEKKNDRQVTMAAEIVDNNGDICASGTGEFILFTEDQFSELGVTEDE
jgi:uncharacterized protein (TIGR00369 family)